jgi:hypothetical protein
MLFTGTVQISREPSLARFKLDPMDNTTLVNLLSDEFIFENIKY